MYNISINVYYTAVMQQRTLDLETIRSAARSELEHNWTGSYYAPHLEGAFPDEFFWDDCFIIMGLAEDNPRRAQELLMRMPDMQGPRGAFANQVVDTTRPSSWVERMNFRPGNSIDAPEEHVTSGISQPPMLAEATMAVVATADREDRQTILDRLVPSIISYHQWLFDTRDINGDGLVTQIHPYETGMDNTPPYENLVMDSRTRLQRGLTSGTMMTLFSPAIGTLRRDFKHADPSERMHNASIAQYQLLTRRLARYGYDMRQIERDWTIPLVEDVTYNSIFMRANRLLISLADMAGIRLPEKLEAQMIVQESGLQELWDPQRKAFFSRNARTRELLTTKTIGSLMPLYATFLPYQQREQLIDDLIDPTQFMTPFPVPSVPLRPAFDTKRRPLHDSRRYWSGPSWLWMNNLVGIGLRQNGEDETAEIIEDKALANYQTLMSEQQRGAFEYYHPITGEGLGVHPFSAAAATIIQFANKRLAKAV